MIQAYKNFWKGYANFTGRSRRSDFWFVYLVNFLIYIFLLTPLLLTAPYLESSDSQAIILMTLMSFSLVVLYFLATIIPSIALIIRRLRDAGFHWALIFAILIPSFGHLIIMVLCAQPTTPHLDTNRPYAYPNQQGFQNFNQNQAQPQAFDQRQEPLLNQNKAVQEDSNQPYY